jgi:hypothetical protein
MGSKCGWLCKVVASEGARTHPGVADEHQPFGNTPRADRQMGMEGRSECTNNIPAHGDPAHGPGRGEVRVLSAERPASRRGAAERAAAGRGEPSRESSVPDHRYMKTYI